MCVCVGVGVCVGVCVCVCVWVCMIGGLQVMLHDNLWPVCVWLRLILNGRTLTEVSHQGGSYTVIRVICDTLFLIVCGTVILMTCGRDQRMWCSTVSSYVVQ